MTGIRSVYRRIRAKHGAPVVEMRTLPVGLSILRYEGYTQQGLSMAAAALTTVLVLIVYMIFQRRIIQGVMVSGLAGR